ncbi:hypothetical protein ACFPOA_15830 [Lysobacter niabensis]|uniref:hypothetical protein n=1 Tax=Agrilutibacter niabensis TaxID=380628 RepID=UPI00361D292E
MNELLGPDRDTVEPECYANSANDKGEPCCAHVNAIFDWLATLEPDESVSRKNKGNELQPQADSDIEKREATDDGRQDDGQPEH